MTQAVLVGPAAELNSINGYGRGTTQFRIEGNSNEPGVEGLVRGPGGPNQVLQNSNKPFVTYLARGPRGANQAMLDAITRIEHIQKQMRPPEGHDSLSYLREARAGAMYGYTPNE
jgi:hypothetical protein